jgi:hypothetical protein
VPSKRVFDIYVEDMTTPALSDFDIIVAAGGHLTGTTLCVHNFSFAKSFMQLLSYPSK